MRRRPDRRPRSSRPGGSSPIQGLVMSGFRFSGSASCFSSALRWEGMAPFQVSDESFAQLVDICRREPGGMAGHHSRDPRYVHHPHPGCPGGGQQRDPARTAAVESLPREMPDGGECRANCRARPRGRVSGTAAAQGIGLRPAVGRERGHQRPAARVPHTRRCSHRRWNRQHPGRLLQPMACAVLVRHRNSVGRRPPPRHRTPLEPGGRAQRLLKRQRLVFLVRGTRARAPTAGRDR